MPATDPRTAAFSRPAPAGRPAPYIARGLDPRVLPAMSTTTFDSAVQMHQSGGLDGAAALYRKLLLDDPDNVVVMNNLSLLVGGQEAETLLRRCVALAPHCAALRRTAPHCGAFRRSARQPGPAATEPWRRLRRDPTVRSRPARRRQHASALAALSAQLTKWAGTTPKPRSTRSNSCGTAWFPAPSSS